MRKPIRWVLSQPWRYRSPIPVMDGSPPQTRLQPLLGDLAEFGIDVNTDIVPSQLPGGNSRRARTHERVQY
jgi:hypothetical protein